MSTIQSKPNRFLKYQNQGFKGKLKLIAILSAVFFIALLLTELLLAAIFLVRAQGDALQHQYIMHRYYILMPFSKGISQLDDLPEKWQQNYIGNFSPPLSTIGPYTPDSLLGFRPQKSISWSHNSYSTVTTNSQGFPATYRDLRTFERDKREDTFRIIVLGGSTVEGFGAKNSMYSLPSLLRKQLDEKYVPTDTGKKRFELINAGVSDYESKTEFLYYISELQFFKPDLVISYNGNNDLVGILDTNPSPPFSMENRRHVINNIVLDEARSYGIVFKRALYLAAHELYFTLQRIFVTDIVIRIFEKAAKYFSNVDHQSQVYVNTEATLHYMDTMALLQRELAWTGTNFAWFLQPVLILTDYTPVNKDVANIVEFEKHRIDPLRQIFSIVSSKMKQRETATKPLKNAKYCVEDISDVLDHTKQEVYLDSVHLNRHGNQLVANRITYELELCGLIKAKLEF